MTQATKAAEPSMEEILASIRKIIADDEPRPAAKAVPKPEPKPEPVAEAKPTSQDDIDALLAGFDEAPKSAAKAAPEPEVLDLTEAVTPPALVKPLAQSADIDFIDATPASTPVPAPRPASAPVVRSAPPEPASELVSRDAEAAVQAAFGSLANTVFGQSNRTIDDVVKEMLRPMLKNWLDDNLPQLVERLVRAEIERVARGGR